MSDFEVNTTGTTVYGEATDGLMICAGPWYGGTSPMLGVADFKYSYSSRRSGKRDPCGALTSATRNPTDAELDSMRAAAQGVVDSLLGLAVEFAKVVESAEYVDGRGALFVLRPGYHYECMRRFHARTETDARSYLSGVVAADAR